MPPYIITQSSVTNNQQRTETNSLLMLRKPRKFLRLLEHSKNDYHVHYEYKLVPSQKEEVLAKKKKDQS